MSSSSYTSPFDRNMDPFNGPRADLGRIDMYEVQEEDENDTGASPTTRHFKAASANRNANTNGNGNGNGNSYGPNVGFRRPFGGDGTSAFYGGAVTPDPDGYPAQYNFARRTSVSAESLKPVADTYDNWRPPYNQKTPEQLQRLRTAIGTCFLFSHLDEEQSAQILGALQEKAIPAKDIKVIEQGNAGDFFYVVEKGSFDVWVNPCGMLQPGPDGMGTKVDTIAAGGSFGELALMYNAPRAATVISAEPQCTLWALDRLTFRRILMESTFARRRMYESFLEEVPLLASLTPYERSKIADVLESQKYPPNTTIIQEGDPGHAFYLLESGEAVAYRNGISSPVKHYQKGDFFGELALLNDAPRAASVVSVAEVRVATMGKSAFQRLLGPVEGIMRRTKYEGVESGVENVDPLHTT